MRSNILRIYVDGVVVASEDIGPFAFHDSTDGLSIGRLNTSSGFRRFLNGWLDALRLTRGVARYGGDFNPPQGPYSAYQALGVTRPRQTRPSSGWHCLQCRRG